MIGRSWSGLPHWHFVLCFKSGIEIIQGIWKWGVIITERWFCFVVCDGLNALPQTPSPCVLDVCEIAVDSFCIFMLCHSNSPGQIGPWCMEGCLVIRPEGRVSGFQQQSHFSSHPRFLVCMCENGLEGSHIIYAFVDVASHPTLIFTSSHLQMIKE